MAVGLLVGCGGSTEPDRLRGLESRLSALEAAARSAASGPSAGVADDVRSLERRLAALEQRLPPLAAGGTAAATPADAAVQRLEQRRARRSRLRDITDEYRARLAAIRQEQTDPAARQQAVREALAWYRDQRRAALAGEDSPQP